MREYKLAGIPYGDVRTYFDTNTILGETDDYRLIVNQGNIVRWRFNIRFRGGYYENLNALLAHSSYYSSTPFKLPVPQVRALTDKVDLVSDADDIVLLNPPFGSGFPAVNRKGQGFVWYATNHNNNLFPEGMMVNFPDNDKLYIITTNQGLNNKPVWIERYPKAEDYINSINKSNIGSFRINTGLANNIGGHNEGNVVHDFTNIQALVTHDVRNNNIRYRRGVIQDVSFNFTEFIK